VVDRYKNISHYVKTYRNTGGPSAPEGGDMKITVEIKTVYGKQLIYPVCENAYAFASLTKKKTFSLDNVDEIKKLGFRIEVGASSNWLSDAAVHCHENMEYHDDGSVVEYHTPNLYED
tara:strand:- start:244 stop:597 length:354 start_codon:yes stop_codon:yes gene_type:complete